LSSIAGSVSSLGLTFFVSTTGILNWFRNSPAGEKLIQILLLWGALACSPNVYLNDWIAP